MNDVERRLAELGEQARRDAGPLRARPEALRRIRVRRGVLSGAAALSVVAVAVGGIGLAGLPATDRDEVRPAQAATPVPERPDYARGPVPHPDEELRVVWPEDTADEAYAGCAESRGRQRTAPAVVSRFATDVLGWESPILDPPKTRSDPWTVTPLGGDAYGGGVDAGVRVWMEEVRPRCWSIRGVSRLPDRRPTGLAISVTGRKVEIGFDPLGAATAEIRVGYGGRRVLRAWNAPADSYMRLGLGFRPETTGSLLILFEDEDGDVFSALATALPAGDFGAG